MFEYLTCDGSRKLYANTTKYMCTQVVISNVATFNKTTNKNTH